MFPKRGAFAAFLTMLALVAILSYQTPTTTPPADNGALFGSPTAESSGIAFDDPTASDAPSVDPTATETASWPADPSADGSSPAPGTTRAPGATAAPATAPPAPGTSNPPSNPTPPPAGTPRPPAPTAAPAGYSGKISGAVASTRYGPVQVRAVFSNGRLTDVVALQLTNADPHSADISNRAAPVLRSEALKAQSAKIHVVSGATYTSNGYIASLQSAIDKKP